MTQKKKSKKIFIIAIALLMVGLGGFVVYKLINKEDGIKVTTEKVSRKTITQTVSAIGKIQPETEVKISSEASGEIMFLGIKDGQQVNANQLLVRIQPDIITSQV
ncbi:MAG TPA: efflux RND transporter periplasmic adaptor subunit, partial [Candidatus Kapabacteria bacterium]|nr:efflux RND transporter periplasmic adaptor subunit [Candidatus Kapabacteria bacterium]